MKTLRTILIFTAVLLGIYSFASWIYAFNSFEDHAARVAAYHGLTIGTMKSVWAQLFLIVLNVLALFLTGLSGMHKVVKAVLAIWLVFATLYSVWALL